MSAAPRVAVIGGGWAGLSAAEALCGRAQTTLFEAGRQCGGRARALGGGSGFAHADNGQHILVGAYRQVLDVLARCGVREEEAFLRLPLQWHLADGLQFSARRLSAPLHLLAGVLGARGIGWGEKTALLRQMRALQNLRLAEDIPVAVWLRQQQVSHRLQQQFWQPLVWGAMNTALEQASLQRLQKYGAQIRLETRVPQIEQTLSGSLLVNGETFDAAVLAAAPYHVPPLLPEAAPPEIAAALDALAYHAITTVYLRYPVSLELPAPITGLAEGTAQWFIDRDALGFGRGEVSAVISLSDQYGKLSREEWIKRVQQDLRRICPHLLRPTAAQVITEKRATTASRIDNPAIPTAWLRHQHIYLAGDYLHPRYPATLEAAVQSGRQAAALLLKDAGWGKAT